VIAYIDIGLAFPEIFSPVEPVADESKFAEDPAPQPKKGIPDGAKPLSE
jgi:hypothetical protein